MLNISKLLIMIVCCGPFIASAAEETAEVTIIGTVKATTCTLLNKAPVISLPTIYAHDFGGVKGKVVSSVAVPISFSNCSANLNKISVKISGTSDTGGGDAYTFKNTSTQNSATGVGIYFVDMNGVKFNPNGSTAASIPISMISGGSVTATYSASYVSTSSEVKPGNVSTTVTAVFTYS
ncbi:fimbrial protein [Erwinia billingiae]|uniref:fimbrial protein n=1 Tax=Erwinia billingiae TaxID=182337 RepID=UPI00124740F9|nr:fimbrial protein [Erwinia billingiae]QEW32581.1 type 1 fimbrial protein [Erwinia billingiae]